MLLQLLSIVFVTALFMGACPRSAVAADPPDEIANGRFVVTEKNLGTGLLPIYVSADWSKAQPDVKRAVLIFHGKGRNAKGYFSYALEARDDAGDEERRALIVAPHFVTPEDLVRLPQKDGDKLLNWEAGTWTGGEGAVGPAPLSSYHAIDAMLSRLADRAKFPVLEKVVLAGHSGGGQILNRYAAVGRGPDKLTALGIGVHFVVANPSSYVYFSKDRPRPVQNCRRFNEWKYGLEKLPRYVQKAQVNKIETTYVGRDVVYLLGTRDNDPTHHDLERGCRAAAQGSQRLERGQSYFKYLKARHSDLKHRLQLVPGVAHSARKMFTSRCGVAVLYDTDGCAAR